MNIGILQTGHARDDLREQHGDYDTQFQRLLQSTEHCFTTYAVVDGELPESIHDQEGWLITGSRHGVYEDHLWIPPLEKFLQHAYADNIPIVGICFGHQILAQALGGTIEKFTDGWSIGPQPYKFSTHSSPLIINAYHQDQITKPPAGAQVIGSSDFCKYAALIYNDRAFTVQAHPEFTNGYISGVINSPSAPQDADLITQANEALAAQSPSPELAVMIDQFFTTRKL